MRSCQASWQAANGGDQREVSKKFTEFEPLLIEGYSRMKERELQIAPAAQPRL